MLAFDAWVGNGDRHPGNWGVLMQSSGIIRLAPMYDPAACLGAELTDGKDLLAPARRTVELLGRYAARCGSGFGDGRRLIRMSQVIEGLRSWPAWEAHAASWIDAFSQSNPAALFARVPDEWLPPARRSLALDLLDVRLKGLRR